MSEKLLNALMELFAIVANIDKIHDRGRRTVSLFLKQQLSLDDVQTYLDKYDEYYLKHSGGSDEKKTRRLVDTPDEIFRNQIELNLTTAFQGSKEAAKRMTNGGSIINISSGAGMRGSPFTGPYAAAKAAMLNMTETLAIELAPKIRVNAVSPGPVVTEAFAEVLGADGAEEEIASTIPLGFLGTPTDIASAVVFLSSPAARWVTGRNLLVAGGRTHRAYQYQARLEDAETEKE